MRTLRVVVLVFLLCGLASAQQPEVKNRGTEIGVWAGGGTGLGRSTSFQFANAGVRLGKVLTGEHGPGFLRGNFEYAADVMPLYLVFQDGSVPGNRQTVYGGSVAPLILKWNFTSGKRVVPWIAIEEGAIFTSKDVPAGDTSTVNFSSGLGTGIQLFRDDRHAVTFSGHVLHISNASLGRQNPSINVAVQFRVGYQWWR
ncbi:MAG: acyloxyacyl hydrolase [Terriglobales bacterium]